MTGGLVDALYIGHEFREVAPHPGVGVADVPDPAQAVLEQESVLLLEHEGDAIDGDGHLTQLEFVAPLDLQDDGFASGGVDADDAGWAPCAKGELALGGVAGAVAVRMPTFRQRGEFVSKASWISAEQALRLGWGDGQDV